jgi:hypothetical protein
LTKVPKIPVDQLISGAVKQYIDYVKNDVDTESEGHLLPLLTGTSEQNSSSDDEKYKTNDKGILKILFSIKSIDVFLF